MISLVKKGESCSSIYKLLSGCFSKDEPLRSDLFEYRDKEIKQLIGDYGISDEKAKLALEQTGNVE